MYYNRFGTINSPLQLLLKSHHLLLGKCGIPIKVNAHLPYSHMLRAVQPMLTHSGKLFAPVLPYLRWVQSHGHVGDGRELLMKSFHRSDGGEVHIGKYHLGYTGIHCTANGRHTTVVKLG